MTRNLTCLVMMICLGCPVFAQNARDAEKAKDAQNAKDAQIKKLLQDAAKKGTPVVVKNLSVNDSVRAQAVLIPQRDARLIFGKEIANNYAVIQLVVGNKSDDASLIIHGIFIDYTHWPLSGSGKTPLDPVPERDKPFQAQTNPNQVASEEYRIVRGQLLEAQNWTWRNVTLRALTLAGSLAGAGAFAFNATENKLISALNGNLPSGFATLFPDPTLEQLKRVDDFGYHTNKVVAQQDSEIIICFFPIDRFLLPGLRKLYLKTPSLFFAPLQILVDETMRRDVEAVLGPGFGTGVPYAELKEALPCYLLTTQYSGKAKDTDGNDTAPDVKAYLAEECQKKYGVTKLPDGKFAIDMEKYKPLGALHYIAAASLNKVTVVVDGVMTVDTNRIAAKIDGIDFDNVGNCDEHSPCFWTDLTLDGGVRKGRIRGSYLTGGKVKIQEADTLSITKIETIGAGSSDQVMHFSFKLGSEIDSKAKLHFIVSKPASGTDAADDSKTTDSAPREYEVNYDAGLHGPTITKVELDKNENILTISGKEFIDAPPNNALVVTLHTPDDEDVVVKTKPPSTNTKLVIDIPADKKVAGCWSVEVSVGAQTPAKKEFAIIPTPKITSAKLIDGNVTIDGEDLVDTSTCGGKKLGFQFITDNGATHVLTGASKMSPKQWIFPEEQAAKFGKAKTTQALLDGEVVKAEPPPAAAKPPKAQTQKKNAAKPKTAKKKTT